MRIVARASCLVVLASLLVLAPTSLAGDGSLGWWGRWQASREARRALDGGNPQSALAAYGRLLAGSRPGDSHRAEALYRSALIALQSSAEPDTASARDFLGRLDGERRADRWALERQALEALLERQEEVRRLATEATAGREEAEATLASKQDEIARVEDLMSRLEAVEAELRRRDEALHQLRAQLVEGGFEGHVEGDAGDAEADAESAAEGDGRQEEGAAEMPEVPPDGVSDGEPESPSDG